MEEGARKSVCEIEMLIQFRYLLYLAFGSVLVDHDLISCCAWSLNSSHFATARKTINGGLACRLSDNLLTIELVDLLSTKSPHTIYQHIFELFPPRIDYKAKYKYITKLHS